MLDRAPLTDTPSPTQEMPMGWMPSALHLALADVARGRGASRRV